MEKHPSDFDLSLLIHHKAVVFHLAMPKPLSNHSQATSASPPSPPSSPSRKYYQDPLTSKYQHAVPPSILYNKRHVQQKQNSPSPMNAPPLPVLTQTLNTAVTASHIRYQRLISGFPVEKICTTHLSSACMPAIASAPPMPEHQESIEALSYTTRSTPAAPAAPQARRGVRRSASSCQPACRPAHRGKRSIRRRKRPGTARWDGTCRVRLRACCRRLFETRWNEDSCQHAVYRMRFRDVAPRGRCFPFSALDLRLRRGGILTDIHGDSPLRLSACGALQDQSRGRTPDLG